ncbi:hypothetical protein VR010_12925 [Actinomycetaceae bacterium L2_0104]
MTDHGLLPQHYAHQVVILHPETVPVLDKYPPFQAPNPYNAEASQEQQNSIDQLFLEIYDPTTPCSFVMYAGYFTKNDWGLSAGFDEPDGTWVLGGRLNYVLFGAPLKESLFATTTERWDHVAFTELSYVWADDRSWFLACPPDLSFTLIGSDNETLADRLLAHPELNALEWTQDAC